MVHMRSLKEEKKTTKQKATTLTDVCLTRWRSYLTDIQTSVNSVLFKKNILPSIFDIFLIFAILSKCESLSQFIAFFFSCQALCFIIYGNAEIKDCLSKQLSAFLK